MSTADTTSTPAAPSQYEGAPLAAEQVSLEEKYHADEYGDRLGETTLWFWGSLLVSSSVFVIMWIPVPGTPSFALSFLLLVGYLGVACAWWLVGKRRRMGAGQRKSGPHPDARLQATGRTDELAWIERLPDVAFEPVIVQRALSPLRIVTEGIAIAPWVGLSAYQLFRNPIEIMEVVVYCCLLMIGLVYWVWRWLCPTYYRISPGQLELVRRSAIHQRIWVQDHYDLRQARVVVRFDKGEVTVDVPEREPLDIQLGSLSEPRQFIKGLCQAAVCTHPAPPLPDDALLG